MGLTSVIEIFFFTPLIFFVPFPPLEIWYFIIATVILHGLYRMNVLYSYKYGDLSFVYPIARGGSSLMIALISILYLSDNISLLGFVGILIVCFGLFLISYSKIHQFNRIAFILATSTAVLITAYTLIDGIGIRKSENAYSYLFWMLLLNGIPVLLIALLSKSKALIKIDRSLLAWGTLAGCLAILSYGIVVWSMQHLEIAYVSSIRETSIVIATLLGFFILQEKEAKNRIVPAALVMVGISIVYFQL